MGGTTYATSIAAVWDEVLLGTVPNSCRLSSLEVGPNHRQVVLAPLQCRDLICIETNRF